MPERIAGASPARPRPRDSQLPPPRGRILGLDFGMRRIGVAIGNTGSGGAQAVATVGARGGVPDWPALQKHIDDWAPAALAVGLPLNMDGSEGDMAKRARKFGRQAGARFGLPVRFVDERLSTRAAEDALQAAVGRDGGGKLARLRAQKRDAMAAALIARAYIDAAGKSTVTAAATEATVTTTATVTEATVTATVTTTTAAADG